MVLTHITDNQDSNIKKESKEFMTQLLELPNLKIFIKGGFYKLVPTN